MKLLLSLGLAAAVILAGGCKRKSPAAAEIMPPPAAENSVVAPAPVAVGEHLTAQVLAEDLMLYTLQIEFGTDQAVIHPDYFSDLDKIGKALAHDPQATARIEGHADRRNTSTPDHNLQLSRRRAAAVADYLKDKCGIASSRMTPTGFGYNRPLEPNDPVSGSPKNRRVEVYIRQGAELPEAGPVPPPPAADQPVSAPLPPTPPPPPAPQAP